MMGTTKKTLLTRTRLLINRRDFRKNPILALYKRILWRFRWKITTEPWILRLRNGQRIAVPLSGSGALIYYQGCSEPELTAFLERVLKPGMVFFDVGAHIGEHVVLGSTLVAPDGQVHAFEPDSRNFAFLEKNVEMNGLHNVFLNRLAVYDKDTTLEFVQTREPSTSHIRSHSVAESGPLLTVKATTLDHYIEDNGIDKVDVLKIDVEGAELYVLRGAQSLLDKPNGQAPIIIFEYSQANCKRFGYHPDEIVTLLKSRGFTIWVLKEGGTLERLRPELLPDPSYHINLVAIKGNDVKLV